MFHMFGAMAGFERSIIRERIWAGLDVARAQGRTGGMPPVLLATDVAVAKAIPTDLDITINEAASRLKVALSTLYLRPPDAGACERALTALYYRLVAKSVGFDALQPDADRSTGRLVELLRPPPTPI
jgi:hypothetical protein